MTSSSATYKKQLPYWLKRGLLAYLLWPLSLLFAFFSILRKYWLTHIKKPWRADVPLVIVGNITAGGSGKTPTALSLIEHLIQIGHHPALVSRGYGRDNPIACVEVTPSSSPNEVGDEPLLIKCRTRIPVFVSAKRIKAVINVLEKYPKTTIIISDDGLQHYSLDRDIEIIVFDERGIGNGWLIPAGFLREPPQRAKSADFIIYNAPTPVLSLPGYMAKRSLGGYTPLRDWYAKQLIEKQQNNLTECTAITWLPMKNLVEQQRKGRLMISAVAGIANPQRFFTMLSEENIMLETSIALPDHYDYPKESFDTIEADIILITEKDAAKCSPFLEDKRLYVVTLSYSLGNDFFNRFDQLLKLQRPYQKSNPI